MTKTFVAVLVMRLRDEGRLDLSDPIEMSTSSAPLTIRQLLSHTSGLASETPGPWWERTPGELRPTIDEVLGPEPIKHPAGQRFHYSNPGFALLGALVEKLRGRAWGEVLADEVLKPLGMHRTSLLPQEPYARGWAVHPWADVLLPEEVHDTGRMAPAGQIWSTVDDLARFAAFLANGDDRVLSAATVAEMRTPHAAPAVEAWDGGYGLGMQLFRHNGRMLAGHTGSMPGYLCGLAVSVDDGLGAVTLTNATAGAPIGLLTVDLVNIVADHEPRLPQPWRPLSEVDQSLLALTGPWYWGPAPFVLRLQADAHLELSALSGTGRGTRFRPAGDGTWLGLNGYWDGETLRPVYAGDRLSHLDIGSFVFTREPYDAAAGIPGGVDPGGWRGLP